MLYIYIRQCVSGRYITLCMYIHYTHTFPLSLSLPPSFTHSLTHMHTLPLPLSKKHAHTHTHSLVMYNIILCITLTLPKYASLLDMSMGCQTIQMANNTTQQHQRQLTFPLFKEKCDASGGIRTHDFSLPRQVWDIVSLLVLLN